MIIQNTPTISTNNMDLKIIQEHVAFQYTLDMLAAMITSMF